MFKILRFVAVLMLMAIAVAGHVNPSVGLRTGTDTATGALVTHNIAVAQAAAPQTTASPDDLYREVWVAVRDNFLWQDRLTDWHNWEHKFRGQLNTVADAERAINQLLWTLNDKYTFYKNANVTRNNQATTAQRNVVTSRMLPGNIGYIRIRTFGSDHVVAEFKQELTKLQNADAFVIDLRDNGGGYIWQAFGVFAQLSDSGVFTRLEGMYQGATYVEELSVTASNLSQSVNGTVTLKARESNLTGNKPIVVLVNNDSASASEMLTGALRVSRGAKVVGLRTFGKGIAQITFNLPYATSVQVTFAQYYFPNGVSIHGVGITPDTTVQPIQGGDSQLTEAIRLAEKELGR